MDFTASFSVSVEGEKTLEKWHGVFKVKTRLSHRDYLQQDRIRRELLGKEGGTPSARAESSAEVFSQLAVRVIDAPPWWIDNGMELADDNVVGDVYERAMKAEIDAIKKLHEDAEAAKKALQEEPKQP